MKGEISYKKGKGHLWKWKLEARVNKQGSGDIMISYQKQKQILGRKEILH